MDAVIENVVQGSMSQAKDWLLSALSHWLHWLVAWFLSTFGWGGLIAMVAGAVLLISLSARAAKFFHSPRGMATAAAIMVGGLAFMWWFRPAPAAAEPGQPTLASKRPPAKPAVAMPPALKPASPPKALALADAPKPPVSRASKAQPDLPFLFFDSPTAVTEEPALPKVTIPHVQPVVVQANHHVAHPAPGKPHATALSPDSRTVTSRPPVNRAGNAAGQQGMYPQNPQFRLQAQRQARQAELAAMEYQYNLMMGHLAGQHMGAMHPGFGMHPSMGHAGVVGHAGSMGHPTGHR